MCTRAGVLVGTCATVRMCTVQAGTPAGAPRPPAGKFGGVRVGWVERVGWGGGVRCGSRWPTTRVERARPRSSPTSPRLSPPAAIRSSRSTWTPRPTSRAGWATARPSWSRWSPPPRWWPPTEGVRRRGHRGLPVERPAVTGSSTASTCCPPATTSRPGSPKRAAWAPRTPRPRARGRRGGLRHRVAGLPAVPGRLTQLGLAAADTVVLVLRPEYDHLQGAIRVRDFTASYRRHLGRPDLGSRGVDHQRTRPPPRPARIGTPTRWPTPSGPAVVRRRCPPAPRWPKPSTPRAPLRSRGAPARPLLESSPSSPTSWRRRPMPSPEPHPSRGAVEQQRSATGRQRPGPSSALAPSPTPLMPVPDPIPDDHRAGAGGGHPDRDRAPGDRAGRRQHHRRGEVPATNSEELVYLSGRVPARCATSCTSARSTKEDPWWSCSATPSASTSTTTTPTDQLDDPRPVTRRPRAAKQGSPA